MRFLRCLLSGLLSMLSLSVMAATMHIKAVDYLKEPVYFELLDHALQITEAEYGPATLEFTAGMVQGRAELALKEGETLHLSAFAPTPEREQTLLPVYFPITQGLLGYRVCLVTEAQLPRFNAISSVQDWRNAELVVGQGAHWPDVDVLRANNMLVVTNPRHDLLLKMLQQQRFDCFARSINELEKEQAAYAMTDVVIEPELLLYYPQPDFFFVSPKYPQLAERLTKGLQKAWESGFAQKHFERHYGAIVQKTRCQQRRLLILENPLLSEKTRQALATYALPPTYFTTIPEQFCQ